MSEQKIREIVTKMINEEEAKDATESDGAGECDCADKSKCCAGCSCKKNMTQDD